MCEDYNLIFTFISCKIVLMLEKILNDYNAEHGPFTIEILLNLNVFFA